MATDFAYVLALSFIIYPVQHIITHERTCSTHLLISVLPCLCRPTCHHYEMAVAGDFTFMVDCISGNNEMLGWSCGRSNVYIDPLLMQGCCWLGCDLWVALWMKIGLWLVSSTMDENWSDTNTNSFFFLGSNSDTNSDKMCRILISILFGPSNLLCRIISIPL